MRQSQLFTKTRKEAPADEVSRNAILLTRAGFIHKEMAGVYSYLPLGLKVLQKIKGVINIEMEKLGSQELIMSSLQNKETWVKTDRWDSEKVDAWFKSKLRNDAEIGFGWSHEEPIALMLKSHAASFRDLPVTVHQFQNKFRNEERAKSGVMRGREFLMKDMYHFSLTEAENLSFYESVIEAYMNVYRKVGLGDITYVTSASGGVFTDKFSHEFQTLSDAGEDNIYINRERKLALNEEVWNEKTLNEMGLKESDFEKKKAIEVGNIFNFGTAKSEELELFVTDNDGDKKPVQLSSYGIGVTRLMGTIVEALSDEKGIVWPKEVAPFQVHLISLGDTKGPADELYSTMLSSGVEVLYDDRDLRAGEKFADADLIGIPTRVVLGEKSLESKMLEVKERDSDAVDMMTIEHLLEKLSK